VFYVKLVLGFLRSPSYNLRQQIHWLNCTIWSIVCLIFLELCKLALIQFKTSNCTISSVVCQIFLRLTTLALIQFKTTNQWNKFTILSVLCHICLSRARPHTHYGNLIYVIATKENTNNNFFNAIATMRKNSSNEHVDWYVQFFWDYK
jgi:hypothetical protein